MKQGEIMKACVICEKHRNISEKVYENDIIIVSHGPIESQLIGYFYIEPKRHVEDWDHFNDKELIEIGRMQQKVTKLLKQELKADRVYSVTISEAVRHLHFHLIPRGADSDIAGLPLIEQATTKKVNSKNRISNQDFENFIKIAIEYFKS
jgi:diadenosine tetraphosphate (Ap4A) HIT family hydrolase